MIHLTGITRIMAQHRLSDLDVRAGVGKGSRGVPECMRGQRRQSRGRDGRFKAGPPEVAGAAHRRVVR